MTDRQNDGGTNTLAACGWAVGTFFPVVPLYQFFGSGGKSFLVVLTYLEYNTFVVLCSFLVLTGNKFLCYIHT